jgi:hypothetical protein
MSQWKRSECATPAYVKSIASIVTFSVRVLRPPSHVSV